jgi:hypothetical protein
MPKNDRKPPVRAAAKSDALVRIAKIEDEPQRVLRRAAKATVTIAAKRKGKQFRIATIRPGEKSDPAFKASLPVTLEALKRRGKRIVELASHLQIVLSVRANRKSALVYFIEPGGDSGEYAAQRLGCATSEGALLKNALRQSGIARAAVDAAARQAGSQHGGEVETLHARIATLERALKKQADLARDLEKNRAALQEARAGRAASEAAAQKIEAERRDEVEPLKRRIAALERSLKQQTALGEAYKKRLAEQPDPEGIPAGTA